MDVLEKTHVTMFGWIWESLSIKLFSTHSPCLYFVFILARAESSPSQVLFSSPCWQRAPKSWRCDWPLKGNLCAENWQRILIKRNFHGSTRCDYSEALLVRCWSGSWHSRKRITNPTVRLIGFREVPPHLCSPRCVVMSHSHRVEKKRRSQQNHATPGRPPLCCCSFTLTRASASLPQSDLVHWIWSWRACVNRD